MTILLTSELRFYRSPDNKIWTKTAFPYSYWKRYLDSFDQVLVLARVVDVSQVESDWKESSGVKVSFISLPSYSGVLQFLFSLNALRKVTLSALASADLTILTLPSPIALLVGWFLRTKNKSYGVEVMGDPWEVFSPNGVKHPLRRFLRLGLTWAQKYLIRHSCSVCYVTERSLQQRYPASAHSFSVGVSNVELQPNHLSTDCKKFFDIADRPLRLISVGSLEQLYKGPDIVLRAMRRLQNQGFNFELCWIGGGYFLEPMQKLSQELGLEKQVHFLGQISNADIIREELDKSDIFVLASRTEGLPRALIEAMARGLPCVGAAVGGIPELLENPELFEPESVDALARLLANLKNNPYLLEKMSQKNLEKGREFLNFKLSKKRSEFLGALRKILDKV